MLENFKILSDLNRLRIYSLLTRGELCVCELEVILEISQSNLSKHLNIMKKNSIIDSRKQSFWKMYSINDNFVKNNKDLHNYIVNQFKDTEELVKDFERLDMYYDKNISCQLASENKEEVLGILNGGK